MIQTRQDNERGQRSCTLEDVVDEEAEGRRQVQLLDEPTERGIEGRWRLHRHAKIAGVVSVTREANAMDRDRGVITSCSMPK